MASADKLLELSECVTEVKNFMNEKYENAMKQVNTWQEELNDLQIVKNAKTTVGRIKGDIEKEIENLKGKINNKLDGIKNWLDTQLSALDKWMDGVKKKIEDFIISLLNSMIEAYIM